jgi:hypothetical protein
LTAEQREQPPAGGWRLTFEFHLRPWTWPGGARCGSRRGASGKARAGLIWGLVLCAAVQLAGWVLTDRWYPELRDPEFGYRLARLKYVRATEPDRPLLVLLGSSRAEFGFRPGVLPPYRLANDATPLVFNFGLSGTGPVREYLTLRRLLAAGVRPNWVVVEVLPPLLHQVGIKREEYMHDPTHMSWADFRILKEFLVSPAQTRREMLPHLVCPWYARRFSIVTRYAPNWIPPYWRHDGWWTQQDNHGWLPMPQTSVTPDERFHRTVAARNEYRPALTDFEVSPVADRAMHKLLDLCRLQGIPAALLLMPESSDFRGFYDDRTRACLTGYLDRLGREYDLPCVDARQWLPDEAFVDGHHILRRAAITFTERLGRELLQPLVEGRAVGPESPGQRMARTDRTR